MNKKLFITCFLVFLLALTGGLLMFEPKVYASEIYDNFPQSVIDQIDAYPNAIICDWGSKVNPYRYVVGLSSEPIYCFLGTNKWGTNYVGFKVYGGDTTRNMLCYYISDDFSEIMHFTTNSLSYSVSILPEDFISDLNIQFLKGNIYEACLNGVNYNYTTIPVQIPVTRIPDDKNIIPDIPNENNIKYVVYWVGNEMKLCTFTQQTPIYLNDNDICYWWFRGTTTYSIYDCYWDYDHNMYAWDLLKTQTFNGISETFSVTELIGTYPDDFEYLKSNYDLEIYNSNKQLIDKEVVINPTKPVVPSDKDPDIPATKFEPEMLPQSLKDKINLDEDINFNEYIYWFYYSVGSNAMSMIASTQPLRFFDNENPNMSDLYVRTQDQLTDIKVKVINWNTNDDFIQVSDKILVSSNYWVTQDTIVHNQFGTNYFSNYNIFKAVLDTNSYNWVLDDKNVVINQNITWSGGSYKDPDDPNGTSGDIWNTIKSYFSSWFIPKNNPFSADNFKSKFDEKFGFMSIFNQVKDIFTFDLANDELPVFNITFNNFNGYSGTCNILDLSWFAPYRNSVLILISIPIYVFMFMFLIKRIPSLLRG